MASISRPRRIFAMVCVAVFLAVGVLAGAGILYTDERSHTVSPVELGVASSHSSRPSPSPTPDLDVRAGVSPGPGELLTWAIADVATGTVAGVSSAGGTSTAESMVKPWIAADYLANHPHVPAMRLAEITRMIRDSDDAAAQDLYQLGGGDAVIARLATVCGITVGVEHSWWSRTVVSAGDAARFGVCLADGRAAGRTWTTWLLDQMRHVAGGVAEQYPGHGGGRWGIIDGLPDVAHHDVAIKNGWTLHPDGRWHVNCLAIIDLQWTLAVLSAYPAALGLAHGADLCARVARRLIIQ